MGAPKFAVPALRILSEQAVEIVAVYTKSPSPAGRRGLTTTKTPVHIEAERLGLETRAPSTLRSDEALAALRDLKADIAIVAAYGILLPAQILGVPRLGCFNLHASLLPRWRGAAPVQRAVMASDTETGVAIMQMEVGLDTGPIAGEVRTPIDPNETAGELMLRLSHLGARTLGDNWRSLVEGRLCFIPQCEAGVTYAHKIDKREALIDWSRPASKVRDHIHALSPFPGAVTGMPGLGRLKILRADVVDGTGKPGEIIDQEMTIACGEGALRLLVVQRAGRNVMSAREFMRSGAVRVGEALAPFVDT